MSNHITPKELSAYLDAESQTPDTIDTHLRDCAICQSSLNSMRSLSQSLQTLPQPEIHPAFAQRVLAEISERESKRARSFDFRWVYRSVSVVAAAAVLIAISVSSRVDAPASGDILSGSQVPTIALNIEQDEDELFAKLNERFAAESSIDSIVSVAYQVSNPEPAKLDPAMIAFALNNATNRTHVGNQWPESKDVRTTINSLSADESYLLKQMLVVHAQEMLLGEAAFKG